MSTNFVYISKFPESVFDAQVRAVLNAIQGKGDFDQIYIIVAIDFREFKEQKGKVEKMQFNPGIVLIPIKSYPLLPFFSVLRKAQLAKARKLIENKSAGSFVVHLREEVLLPETLAVFNKKSNKIFVDIRAARIEEIDEYQNQNVLIKKWKICKTRRSLKLLNRACGVFAVSKALKEYLSGYCDVVEVVPSVAANSMNFDSKSREEVRRRLGINPEETLFVFSSGGNAMWQKAAETFTFMRERGYRVLNLSRHQVDEELVMTKFVPFNEMSAYLSASDIAILWRDKSVVNDVASPVKFAEYVCCGLPVITSKHVDQSAEFVRRTGNGAIIDELDALREEDIREILKLNRDRISEQGRDFFGIDQCVLKYLKAYQH